MSAAGSTAFGRVSGAMGRWSRGKGVQQSARPTESNVRQSTSVHAKSIIRSSMTCRGDERAHAGIRPTHSQRCVWHVAAWPSPPAPRLDACAAVAGHVADDARKGERCGTAASSTMSFLSSSLRMARLTFFRSCPGLVICTTRGRRVHPCVSTRARAQRLPDPESQQRHDPHDPVHRRTMPFLVTRCGVLETPGIVPVN